MTLKEAKAEIAELTKDRDAWISEYRASRAEVERLKERVTKLERELLNALGVPKPLPPDEDPKAFKL